MECWLFNSCFLKQTVIVICRYIYHPSGHSVCLFFKAVFVNIPATSQGDVYNPDWSSQTSNWHSSNVPCRQGKMTRNQPRHRRPIKSPLTTSRAHWTTILTRNPQRGNYHFDNSRDDNKVAPSCYVITSLFLAIGAHKWRSFPLKTDSIL